MKTCCSTSALSSPVRTGRRNTGPFSVSFPRPGVSNVGRLRNLRVQVMAQKLVETGASSVQGTSRYGAF